MFFFKTYLIPHGVFDYFFLTKTQFQIDVMPKDINAWFFKDNFRWRFSC